VRWPRVKHLLPEQSQLVVRGVAPHHPLLRQLVDLIADLLDLRAHNMSVVNSVVDVAVVVVVVVVQYLAQATAPEVRQYVPVTQTLVRTSPTVTPPSLCLNISYLILNHL